MSSMACSTSKRRPAGRREVNLPIVGVKIERDREGRPLVFQPKQHRLERRDRLESVAGCSPHERLADR